MIELEAAEHRSLGAGGYRRLLRRDPGSARFVEFADLCRRQGLLSEATCVCARGLTHHPQYPTGRVVMGEILADQGMSGRAEEEWREAVRLDPYHPRARFRLGELYLSRGEPARATGELEAALLLNPGFAEAQALLNQACGADRAPVTSSETAIEARADQAPAVLRGEGATEVREVLAAVSRCPSVETAMVVDSAGLLHAVTESAGQLPSSATVLATRLGMDVRSLLARLGVGVLRSFQVQGRAGTLWCLPLSEMTVVAALKPQASLCAAGAEMVEAISRVRPPAPLAEVTHELLAA